jgi:catechol 2,3-dioxygenase-like lactoylglutathione lyase family enzyme
MLFGRFLEIGVSTPDIAASVTFYEALGFAQLNTTDTWTHPYGVVSDGRLCLGLHQSERVSPTLTFVRPDLARHVQELRAVGFEPHYARLGDEDFHEVQLREQSGQIVTLLEARTHLSPAHAPLRDTQCGYFSALSLPALDFDNALAFWDHAGFVALDAEETPYPHLPLTSDWLNLNLHRPRWLDEPALVFTAPDMAARLDTLRDLGHTFSKQLPRELATRGNALLEAPEGTLLLLLSADG